MTTLQKVLKFKTDYLLMAEKLVTPARSAFNQMQDAGMKEGSRELGEVLFKLDAIKHEYDNYVESLSLSERLELLKEVIEKR